MTITVSDEMKFPAGRECGGKGRRTVASRVQALLLLCLFTLAACFLVCSVVAGPLDQTKIAYVNRLLTEGGENSEIYVMDYECIAETQLNADPDYSGFSWSPDKSKILFSSGRDGDGEIYSINADGSGLTQLTNNNWPDGSPSWSPDGTKIAFTSVHDWNPETGGHVELYLMNSDGTGEVQLTSNEWEETSPVWSPVGTKIAFLAKGYNPDGSLHSEIYVVDSDGTGEIPLTNSELVITAAPAWSPDGTKIVFTSRRPLDPQPGSWISELYVINPDGTGEIRLTEPADPDNSPAWSPDGTKILFVSGDEITLINTDGSGLTKLTNNEWSDLVPSWIPDGSKIAFVSRHSDLNGFINYDTSQIYVINSNGTGETQFTHVPRGVEYFSWSPDGNKIAFTSTSDGSLDIYIKNTDDVCTITQLTNNPEQDVSPIWSPDGTKIAFVSTRDGNNEIYSMNADGSNVRRLTDNPSDDRSPTWSPDGSKIAFSSLRDELNGWSQIYSMNNDGTDVSQITNKLVVNDGISWSPDGTKIAYSAYDGDNCVQIYIINPDGTNDIQLTDSGLPGYPYNTGPVWSPDGTKIAFVSTRDGEMQIYLMNADGTGVLQVPNSFVDSISSWSPDGTKLLYNIITKNEGGSGSRIINLDGTGKMRITDWLASDLVWSPLPNTNPNQPPVADAGITSRSIILGDTVTLDAGRSSDPNNNDLTYRWTLTTTPTGSAAQIANPTDRQTTFTPDIEGTYTVQLIANDGSVDSESFNIQINAITPSTTTYSRIAYASEDAEETVYLYVMNADGTDPTLLTSDVGRVAWNQPAWSPDGTKIAFASNRDEPEIRFNEIYVMNADGSGVTRLTDNPGRVDTSPTWSPDGTKIAYVSDQGPEEPGYTAIYVMNADGMNKIQLTDRLRFRDPAWSPDGTKIAYASEDAEDTVYLYVMNADGTGSTLLTTDMGRVTWKEPVWSPDGTKIAFTSNRDEPDSRFNEIYVMNADGSGVTRLTDNPGRVDTSPTWSPDGTKIAYVSDQGPEEPGYTAIYVMNADGMNKIQLTDRLRFRDPAWSPPFILNPNQPPFAVFTFVPDNPTTSDTIAFTDASTDPDGTISTYSWAFGDGTTATESNPTHQFTAPGQYQIMLTATDDDGETGKATRLVIVDAPGTDTYVLDVPGMSVRGTQMTIDTSLAGTIVSTSGSTVTIDYNGLVITIGTSGITTENGVISGQITSINAQSDTITADLPTLGPVYASFEAAMNTLPAGAEIESLLTETVTPDVQHDFELVAMQNKVRITGIAYVMEITKTNLHDGTDIGAATIRMSVSPDWVTAHGGPDKIRIIRYTNEDTMEILQPTWTIDATGQYVFEAISPNGLSVFGLVGTDYVPVADAGEDQLIQAIGTNVALDGTPSYDEDGDPITFQWAFVTRPAGSAATLSGETTATPSFTADVHGDYVIQLVVSDAFFPSDPDQVTVSFENVRPVADAGMSVTVILGETVTLDGTQSSDLNGDPLTYQWSLTAAPTGSIAHISSPANAHTTFVPDIAGSYSVQLIVNDGFASSEPAVIQVEVITRTTKIITDLRNLETSIGQLPSDVFRNANMQNTLINKLNAVIAAMRAGDNNGALNKLQNDVLAKTDGCAQTGTPDKNDWVVTCTAQSAIYPEITSILNEMKG